MSFSELGYDHPSKAMRNSRFETAKMPSGR